MKTIIRQKIEWAKEMIEMHQNDFGFDSKQKHQRRINELNGMIEVLESLLKYQDNGKGEYILKPIL